jgi:uroporphyrinogen III methyltransferase/synthase
MKGGMVYLVGAGPGDPGLITLRGLECLKQANVVIYDRLVNRSLLAYARHAEQIDVGKQPNRHTMPQPEINALLIEKARAGNMVVRLKGGDPFVFGRGGEEALALAKAGLPFEIVPGVTSATAAPAYAGIPVTHRKLACSVAFATGHRADFVEDPTCDWRRLANSTDTLVFLMGVHNLSRIVEQLIAYGRAPETPVALVERATLTSQKTVVGTLANIVERAAEVRPPAAIIVGEVVRLRETLRWFDLPDRHPLLGLRVLNTQPPSEAGELSWRLMALGAEPMELPTTQVVAAIDRGPLDTAINRLCPQEPLFTERNNHAYDWVVLTSSSSASFFINRLFALGHDVRALAGVKLAVADTGTAETLLEYGLVADFIPMLDAMQDIASEIGETPGQRVLLLLPSAPLATTDLTTALRAQGTSVQTAAAYTIQPTSPDPVALSALLDGNVDVATFVDAYSLTSLAKMLNNRPVAEVLSPLTTACINPSTAEAASALGVRVDLIAEKHTIQGLIDALVKWRTKEGRL